jgi:hypothetical protein
LAASEIPPICIIEQSPAPVTAGPAVNLPDDDAESSAKRLGLMEVQCLKLRELLRVIPYGIGPTGKDDPTEPFFKMLDGHLQDRKLLAATEEKPPVEVPTTLDTVMIYNTVWQNCDQNGESSLTPADELLENAGLSLLIDEQLSQSRLLYPRAHRFTRKAAECGCERLLAAWLLLHHGYGPERLRTDDALAKRYVRLGWTLLPLLNVSNDPRHAQLAAEIQTAIMQFEESSDVG